MCVGVSPACMSPCARRRHKGGTGSPGTGGGHHVGAGNPSQVLWKSNKCCPSHLASKGYRQAPSCLGTQMQVLKLSQHALHLSHHYLFFRLDLITWAGLELVSSSDLPTPLERLELQAYNTMSSSFLRQ